MRMKIKHTTLVVAILAAFLILSSNGRSQTRPPLRPLPPGVTELTGIGADGGIVQLRDGTLMLAQGAGINDGSKNRVFYRLSKDGGKAWSPSQPLNSEIGVGGLLRLKSGALAIYGRNIAKDAYLWEYYFS